MMVKLFCAAPPDSDLEVLINDWIQIEKPSTIYDIKLASAFDSGNGHGEYGSSYRPSVVLSALVMYKERG